MRGRTLLVIPMSFALALPGVAAAETSSGAKSKASTEGTGGSVYGVDPAAPARVFVPGTKAKRMKNGLAAR